LRDSKKVLNTKLHDDMFNDNLFFSYGRTDRWTEANSSFSELLYPASGESIYYVRLFHNTKRVSYLLHTLNAKFVYKKLKSLYQIQSFTSVSYGITG